MPIQVEHEGNTITVFTESEVNEKIEAEVKGLKITNENLKAEKTEAIEKAREAKEQVLAAEEAKAKAEGNTEELKRISDQREQEAMAKLNEFKSTIQAEKVTNMLSQVVDSVGASGQLKEDLRDLLKSRFEFGYDMDTHSATVKGDGVQSLDDLLKVVKESGRYDAYLPGDGSSGGGSLGNNGAGVSTKKPSEMTSAERIEFKQRDPEGFKKAFFNS